MVTARRACIAALLLTACGRVWFDPRDDEGGSDAGNCGHTFCDDFDRTGAPEDGWSARIVTGAATVAIASGGISPSSHFEAGLPMTAIETALLERTFALTSMRATVDLDIGYASTTPGTAEIDLVRLRWIRLPAGCTSFGYFLVRDGTGPFNMQETYGGCGGNENNLLSNFDNTGFHHVRLDVTFGPIGIAHVTLGIDGTAVIDKATTHAIEPSEIELQIGGDAVRNMAAPWQFSYDNVLVDLE